MFTNADVLTMDKLNEIRARIKESPPDVLSVSEAKPKNCKEYRDQVEYKIEGYDLVTKNMDGKPGRGMCLYIRSLLEYKIMELDTTFDEYLAVEIKLKDDNKVMFVGVYRSPNSSKENNGNLLKLMNELSVQHSQKRLILCGDINYRNIDWENWLYPENDEDSDEVTEEQALVETTRDCFMMQHITEVTRARGNNRGSVLDLLFTWDYEIINDIGIEAPIGKSDHALISAEIPGSAQINGRNKIRCVYDKGDYDLMREKLNLDWEASFADMGDDVEKMWDFLKTKIKEAEKECVPTRTVYINGKKSKKHSMKLDTKVMAKIKRKNRLWFRYKQTMDGQIYEEYRRLSNQVRAATRRAAKAAEKAVCTEAKTNAKRFWKYVSSKTKSRPTIPELYEDLEIDEKDKKANKKRNLTKNDSEKTNVFNDYFASVFNLDDENTVWKNIGKYCDSKIPELEITEEKVLEKLNKLKIAKSPGPDGMHPRILKELTSVICKPLTLLYQTSVKTGLVPSEWRDAHVTAIYKKGDRHFAGNYRPVSLTSIVCKILESLVRDHIIKYMKTNKLFSKRQFGFIGGRSTVLQLLKILDLICEILDRGGSVDVVYFDFMKAFDKVSHERLIMKLESYGIDGAIQKWIKAFLSDRRQRVVVNRATSEWAGVTSGVPQGSVLGPLLFVIFINDLPDVVSQRSNPYMFADDTKMIREISNVQDNLSLQSDIDAMLTWSVDNKMFFHSGKCKVLGLGYHKSEFVYKMREVELERVPFEKDLGVIFDDSLSFEKHISEKTNKANKVVGIIRRTFCHLDKEMFLTLYKAQVRPLIEYANQVWSPRLNKHRDSIENVQRRATKLIPGMKNKTYEERLELLKLPSLAYRRLRGDLIEMYKIATLKYDEDVSEGLLVFANDEAGTRGHSLKLFKIRCRLEVRKRSFPHRTLVVWNELPQVVINAPKVDSFERRLDKFLSKKELYYDYKADAYEKINAKEIANELNATGGEYEGSDPDLTVKE